MIYTIEQIKTILEPIFQSYDIKEAILFGSYSTGKASEDSDIDILIDSGLKGLSFYGLLNDVMESLNKDIDLFDFRQFDQESSVFKEIRNKGTAIF